MMPITCDNPERPLKKKRAKNFGAAVRIDPDTAAQQRKIAR
jgi:hypothetical protein